MTNPKDPQAELFKAVESKINEALAWAFADIIRTELTKGLLDKEGLEKLVTAKTAQILALFQAHQQELLTELLGELPEKPKKDDIAKIMTTDYTGDNMARAYQLVINQVVEVIERYREGLHE